MMPERTEFHIKSPEVDGEIWENTSKRRALVLSHGFGVKRDSRGMYTQLAERLADKFSVVMFDYGKIDDKGNTTTPSFSEQSRKLEAVLEYVATTLKPQEIDLVGHSQGCLIVGLVSPDNVNKFVLLSSPVSAPGKRMKDYFSKRPGTTIDTDSVSTIARSDGSLTYLHRDFWPDAEQIDVVGLYKKLADKGSVYFVRPLQDQVVTGEDYQSIKQINGLSYIEINGDHDFNGQDREELLKTVLTILEES